MMPSPLALLSLARFQLQVGRIVLLLVIALMSACMCAPLLGHGDDAQPLLAQLVHGGFIIIAPLLVQQALPCLAVLPVARALVGGMSFLMMVVIALLGALPLLIQIPLTTPAMIQHGWPTHAAVLSEIAQTPLWVLLMALIAPSPRCGCCCW